MKSNNDNATHGGDTPHGGFKAMYGPEADQEDIRKCRMEPGSDDDNGNTTWAVEVPDDASVQVQLVVKADGVEEVVGGAGNMSGRYELKQIQEGENDE